MPLYPFENPLHALLLVGFGLAFWTIGTAVRTMGNDPDKTREFSRHNPYNVLVRGRSNTADEEKQALPDGFFAVYGAMGALMAWIGYAIMFFGASGLVVSLGKKLFQ